VIAEDRVFLNLGTRAKIPDVPGLVASQPMTHVEALDLDRLPDHLMVLGSGYVGLELAQAMRRLGAKVTLIERGAQLASREDADIGAALLELFQSEGINVLLNTKVLSVEGRSGQQVHLHLQDRSGEQKLEGSDLLVATGRTPNTDGIGLEQAGIKLTAQGYVEVNERLETTDPELARVGLNELEAKAHGIEYRLVKLPMAAVLRMRTLSELRGFIKLLIATDSDRILGLTALGTEASEMMAAVQTAMLGGLPYTLLRDALFAHPTTAEGLNVLLRNVPAQQATKAA
jgi:pyruvate/2-oxoglutarate dehydrogenase complex dihydrolipoamide dehydrogenase (E3) component